jgi:hypothetical protein
MKTLIAYIIIVVINQIVFYNLGGLLDTSYPNLYYFSFCLHALLMLGSPVIALRFVLWFSDRHL